MLLWVLGCGSLEQMEQDFPFEGAYQTWCDTERNVDVVDVYDGDTCRVVFNLNNQLNKWTIRMNGYDTPEMRPSRSLENRDEIKKKAIESRDYLKSLIMNENQLVYLQ